MRRKPEPFILSSLAANLILTCKPIIIPYFIEDSSQLSLITFVAIQILTIASSLIGLTVGIYRLSKYPDNFTGAGLLPFIILFLFDAVLRVFRVGV